MTGNCKNNKKKVFFGWWWTWERRNDSSSVILTSRLFFFFFRYVLVLKEVNKTEKPRPRNQLSARRLRHRLLDPPLGLFSLALVFVSSLSLSLSLELYFYLFIRVEKLALRAKRVMMMAQSVAHKLFSDGWKKNKLNQLEFPVRSFIDAHFFGFFVALTAPSFPAK